MSNSKISALTSATTPLAGTEVLPIVQSGTTTKVTVTNLTAGRAVSMLSLTADTTTLVVDSTNHRVGVGTASPSYNVDIKGMAGTNAYVRVQSNNAGDYSSGVLLGDTVSVRGSVIYDQYYNLLRLSGNSVECLNMGGTGDVKVLAGNLVQGTAAKGINFAANTPAAGMTSQLLNWYEEGTWTPVLGGSGGTSGQAYNFAQGKYVRVGNNVTCHVIIQMTTIGTITGNLQLQGLPFAIFGYMGFGAGYTLNITSALGTSIILSGNTTATACTFYVVNVATGVTTALTSTAVSNATQLITSFSYITS